MHILKKSCNFAVDFDTFIKMSKNNIPIVDCPYGDYMIGDASGKKGQWSDTDKKTAENFGIDYMDVDDFTAELVENYTPPQEYYNIKVTFERQSEDDEMKDFFKYPNLYINGILVNVAYYNFNKSIEVFITSLAIFS